MCSAKHRLWEILQNNKHAQSITNLQEKKGKQSQTIERGCYLDLGLNSCFPTSTKDLTFHMLVSNFLKEADYFYK